MGDDRHAERRRAARDLLADAAQADEAEDLLAHLFAQKLLLLPLALLHRRVGAGNVPGERQHERHRELGDADAVGARRVHHDDAAGARGGTSTLSTPVPARAMARSWGAAAISAAVTLRRAANHDRVGVGDVGGELLGGAARSGVDLPAFVAEQIERGSREVVGDKDLHGFREKYNLPVAGRAAARHTRKRSHYDGANR